MREQMRKVKQLLHRYQELPEYQGITLNSVNQRGGFKSTPLHIAIYRENPEEVAMLLRAKADPNAAGECGERPLHVAVNCANGKIVEQLLRAGARCEFKDDKGMDAWQVAEAVGFRQRLEEIVHRITRNQ